jgi:hypothetical protein
MSASSTADFVFAVSANECPRKGGERHLAANALIEAGRALKSH